LFADIADAIDNLNEFIGSGIDLLSLDRDLFDAVIDLRSSLDNLFEGLTGFES